MKKIAIIFLIIFIIFGMGVVTYSNAAENGASVEVTAEGPTSIEIGTKSITLTLKLGKFTGIEEETPLGYETVLKYNKDAISSVTVEGLNGWTAEYSKSTQRIIGRISSAKANTQIAKITYQLNDNLTEKTDLGIVFSEFLITDSDTLKQKTDITKAITIKKAETSESEKQESAEEQKQEAAGESKDENLKPQSQEQKPVQQQEQQISKVDNKEKSTTNEINADNTKAKSSSLPKAGLKTVVPLILIIAIVGLVFIARSKSIKLK